MQARVHALLSSQKFRFTMVGGANTAIDFGIFLLFHSLIGLPIVLANIISTTIALSISFILNSTYTFGGSPTKRRIALYFSGTLFGLWVLQPLVLVATQPVLSSLIGGLGATIVVITAKLLATVVSLIWNYVWYKNVVFRGTA